MMANGGAKGVSPGHRRRRPTLHPEGPAIQVWTGHFQFVRSYVRQPGVEALSESTPGSERCKLGQKACPWPALEVQKDLGEHPLCWAFLSTKTPLTSGEQRRLHN